jgi:hypothetical protein
MNNFRIAILSLLFAMLFFIFTVDAELRNNPFETLVFGVDTILFIGIAAFNTYLYERKSL